ncbi:MAG: 4Fe-4S dicluster domain-containing protein, partial [Nitrospiria bacterium]
RWIPIRPGSEGILAMGLSHVILKEGWHAKRLSGQEVKDWRRITAEYNTAKVSGLTDIPEETIRQLARDFSSIRPSMALCGASPMARPNGLFHAVAVNILNYVAGNLGQKGGIRFYPPFETIEEKRLDWQQVMDLPRKIKEDRVQALLFHEANLLFHAPRALDLQKALEKVPLIVSFSSFIDETTAFSDLVLPLHTPLESFGDYIPEEDGGFQGIGLMQPIVPPLYDTRPLGDILVTLAGDLGGPVSEQFPWDNFEEFLKETWEEYFFVGSLEGRPGFNFEFKPFWAELLQKGGRWEKRPSRPRRIHPPNAGRLSEIVEEIRSEGPAGGESFHLHLYPSLYLYDGRGANQPWLQEAPDPMTSIAWGSWIEINAGVAEKLGIKEGDLLKIQSANGSIEAPAYPTAGIRPDTVAMPIGQGHTAYGRYAKGRGANPLEILALDLEPATGSLAWAATRVSIEKTGKQMKPAKTEGVTNPVEHETAPINAAEAARLRKKPSLKPIEALPNRTGIGLSGLLTGALAKYLRPELHNKEGDYRWGMTIDLDRCTGCGACNVACHAENNLPIVGEEGIRNQREINWIRVERYWKKEPSTPQQAVFFPMLCQHCANAPCEPVCPVYATYHTPDGLNAQVYNRCVGTRYCAVNCPYKVRYFNWKKPEWPEPLDRQLNPDLSVREAGIMEKCTFCVQRIRTAKEDAKIEGRMVRDGEIQPACVQACPSNAMQFGSLLDHQSAVSKAARDPRRYRALEHLNTESAVVYLKRVIDV